MDCLASLIIGKAPYCSFSSAGALTVFKLLCFVCCVLCSVCVLCVVRGVCVLLCVCLHTSYEVYFHFQLPLPLPLPPIPTFEASKIENSDETKPSCDGVMLRLWWSVEKEVEKFNENTEIPSTVS